MKQNQIQTWLNNHVQRQHAFNDKMNGVKTFTDFTIALMMEVGELMNEDPKCKIWKDMEFNKELASKELADIWIFFGGMDCLKDNKFTEEISYLLAEPDYHVKDYYDDPENQRPSMYIDLMSTLSNQDITRFGVHLCTTTYNLLKVWGMTLEELFEVIDKKTEFNYSRTNFKFKDKDERV